MPIVKIKKCVNCSTRDKAVPHEWLFEGPTLKELRTIKKLTGLNSVGYAEASQEGDPEALAALVYILHQRSKLNIPFDDVDLDFNDFDMEETAEEKKEREAEERAEKRKAAKKA